MRTRPASAKHKRIWTLRRAPQANSDIETPKAPQDYPHIADPFSASRSPLTVLPTVEGARTERIQRFERMPEPVDSRHTGKAEVPAVQLGCLPVRPETLGPALLTVSPKTRPVSALETPDQLSDSVCQVLPERFNVTSADDFFDPRPPHRALEPFPENRPEGQFQDHNRLCALKNQRPEIAGAVIRHSAARDLRPSARARCASRPPDASTASRG